MLIMVISIVVIWICLFLRIPLIFAMWGVTTTLADTINAISSIFTALAFAGIILTVFLQKEELALQRQELVDTRKELQRTAVAQEKSEAALSQQVRSMQLSAELNALNSLISLYYGLEGSESMLRMEHRHRRELYQKRLEALLKMLQDESLNPYWVVKDKPSIKPEDKGE